MRQDILEYLLAHKGEFVSGQKISEHVGISRTAVWKHIHALKKKGYVIESFTKKGYCLQAAPELLQPDVIRKGLQTKVLGHTIHYYEKLDSTNNVAKKLADQGEPEGTIVIAEEQTGGRGRLSRSFFSPYGKGLWFSVILRPDFSPMEVSKMTLLAAVALTKAFRKMGLTGGGIKWPNDILVHNRKLVGILTELNASAERINYLVMGIGINTDISQQDLPRELREAATSFAIEKVPVHRAALLQEVLRQLEAQYMLAKESGFAPILEEWKNLSCMLGQMVDVILPNTTFRGKAVDLDETGNLIVMTDEGPQKVIAGDVHVRPAVG
ncbi:MAG: biotin--[acetyl-CoA-carboxylase] ligase [Megasphaera sp.]|jgi:BirA family biotin operon repressor/biotin-[acetyl-CoA-carboxylase] ligase|nr:biotin--[acetyl-CoA-carboxylase] ligase [Megasphaera sp.]MCI1247496.1 biotin--[acetyl-CoA-carboxylase] ligase [Megasphaera sp.]